MMELNVHSHEEEEVIITPPFILAYKLEEKVRKNGLAILGRALGKESKHLEREQKGDSIRKRERCKEI